MRTCNTLIECSSYLNYEEAGAAMDRHNKREVDFSRYEWEFTYRPMYVSKGIVVQVYKDGKLVGYIAER